MTPPDPVRRAVGALMRIDTWQDGLVGLDGRALASTVAALALRQITAAASNPVEVGYNTAADPISVAAAPSSRGGAPQ